MTTEATTSTLPLDELAGRLRGELALPGSDGYARLAVPWNVAVASRPIAVAAVADADDVAAVVRWARETGARVAVRCTGHGAADELDDTLLVHTGRLDALEVTDEGRARIGAGVRWTRVLEAAGAAGFAAVAGSAPNVGVVGYLTGGGIGPLARTCGVSADHVTAFELVTGDGTFRRATAALEPELFWALKGGKGALGIVTAVELDLVRLPALHAGALYFDGADAARVLHAWAAWCVDLPAEATTSAAILRLPPLPGVPGPLAGRTTVAIRYAWTGEPEPGDAALAPIRAAAPVIFGEVGLLPSAAQGAIHADPVDPMPVTERSMLLSGLPAGAVDALLGVAGPESGCALVVVELRQLGGAVATGGGGSLGGRDAAFTLNGIGIDAGPHAVPAAASGAALMAAMAPWDTGKRLPNFEPSTDPAQVLRVYDRETLDRLGALIDAVDPDEVISAADPVRAARRLAGP